MIGRQKQCGSVLILVLVALVIMAALSRILHLQLATRMDEVRLAADRQSAQYLAEAGLRHALWRVRNANNGIYPANINGNLQGQGTYKASITPTTGSPITVTSTGTTQSGGQFKVTRTYALACNGNPPQTLVMTAYAAGMEPDMIYQASSSAVEPGFFDPRANTNRQARLLIAFDLSRVPKGIPLLSAEMMLYVEQHDASMEGGKLLVNRLVSPWVSGKADWTASSTRTAWSTPGGDYTLVDETSVIISPTATVYAWNIKALVEGWANNKFPHYGLILRANIAGSEAGDRLRLRKRISGNDPATDTLPRLIVKYCT